MPASGKHEILVEPPLTWAELNLPPLADASRHVAGFFQHGWDHDFTFRIDCRMTLIAVKASAERISSGERFAARGTTQRRCIAVGEVRAFSGQFVDIGRAKCPA